MIHQEVVIATPHMCVPNNRAAKYGNASRMDRIRRRDRQIHTSRRRPAPVSKQWIEQLDRKSARVEKNSTTLSTTGSHP